MPTPSTTEPSGQDGNSPLYDSLFKSVEQPQPQQDDRRPGRSIHDVLAEVESEVDKPDGTPADKDKDKDKDGKPPADKPETKPEDKPDAPPAKVRVTKKKVAPEPLPEPEPEPEPEPVRRKAAAKPEPEPEPEPEVELNEEETDALESARFAEGLDPVKYKGYAGKLEKFYKAHADFVKQKRAQDPDFDFSEDNPEYSAWVQANRPPQIPQHEMKRIERERIRADVTKEAESKVEAIRNELRLRDEMPKIRERANKFMGESFRNALPDEAAALLKEKGLAAVKEAFPLEYQITAEVAKQASEMVSEFYALTSGLKKFNQDTSTEEGAMHKSIIEWIENECSEFAAKGGQYRIRDGKTFLDRTRYHSLPAAQRAKFWTFSNDELVMIAQGTMKRSLQVQLAEHREHLKKMGFVQQARAASAPPAETAPKPTPAQVRSSQAPGAAPAAPANEQGSGSILGVLGI